MVHLILALASPTSGALFSLSVAFQSFCFPSLYAHYPKVRFNKIHSPLLLPLYFFFLVCLPVSPSLFLYHQYFTKYLSFSNLCNTVSVTVTRNLNYNTFLDLFLWSHIHFRTLVHTLF